MCILSSVVQVQLRTLAVTIDPAATDSVTFAPIHPGFHRGLLDMLDIRSAAALGIFSLTAGGVTNRCKFDFVTAPSAVRGSSASPLLLGAKKSPGMLR